MTAAWMTSVEGDPEQEAEEWRHHMRHPSWPYIDLDRDLFGTDFGDKARRDAYDEAAAEENR